MPQKSNDVRIMAQKQTDWRQKGEIRQDCVKILQIAQKYGGKSTRYDEIALEIALKYAI